MSECKWCDTHEGAYPDSDPDSRAMSVPVPKLENGVKVGIAYTVERHQCGDCVRTEQATIEKRRAIAAGVHDAEHKVTSALREAWER